MSWVLIILLTVKISEAFVIENENNTIFSRDFNSDFEQHENADSASSVFNGVYTECFLYLSYSCLQKKTLLYLNELNKLSEVSVIGEYVKFVKVNDTDTDHSYEDNSSTKNSEELSNLIDKAVNKFFNSHILKFSALGNDVSTTHTVEEFVGRKRKGGGGGGGGGGGHGGGDDGGKKKMMMMAMMCMKMKLMMMVPAMMGMMGMMSFKGMMFSMMSFMVSKMMLLMKILEKKGGGGGGGGGGDGGWAAAGGGGGGTWMPAGGQDYGGGGGGYDANGQWQSRSIADDRDKIDKLPIENLPIVSYAPPTKYRNKIIKYNPYSVMKSLNDEVIKLNENERKSRKKRGLVDVLQNAYFYWINRMLGVNRRQNLQPKYPKYKIINGVKYVYYPLRFVPKVKAPKELTNQENVQHNVTPLMIAEDFEKGEIIEGPVEARMNKKKMQKMKTDVNEVVEDNPWE